MLSKLNDEVLGFASAVTNVLASASYDGEPRLNRE